MAAVKSKNSRIEIALRSDLHGRGFRFRLHARHLPGTPDLVLTKFKAVVFIHGCFWHMHDCRLFKLPQTRQEFWLNKLKRNAQRDQGSIQSLLQSGWRVAVIWECATRGPAAMGRESVAEKLSEWLKSNAVYLELGAVT